MNNKITKNIIAMIKSIGANEDDDDDSESTDGEESEEENADDVKAVKEK